MVVPVQLVVNIIFVSTNVPAVGEKYPVPLVVLLKVVPVPRDVFDIVSEKFICKQSVNVPAGTVRVTLKATIVMLPVVWGAKEPGVDVNGTQVVPTEKEAGSDVPHTTVPL